MESVRVFVGSDRSQSLAVRVLEHSIRRHTNREVDVYPMVDLPVREPRDPRQGARTGFSFSRFCIPRLCNYTGKAIYLDADMLVFSDIAALWEIPFDSYRVVIQKEVRHVEDSTNKYGAPKKRIKQSSVMLLDCSRLDWDIEAIIHGLDTGDYTYEELMYHLCILGEGDIKYGVPFEWNSLEHYDTATCLIHYTDMLTQPWVSPRNKNGHLWLNEVRLMLRDGSLRWQDLKEEVDLGYFRPSLLTELRFPQLPQTLLPVIALFHQRIDRRHNFVMHKEVYEAKRRRQKLIAEYERSGSQKGSGISA